MLKKILTTDIQIKIGSLILAILLWFFVVTDIEYFYDLEIPLRIDGLSEDKALNNEIPELITARFRGKGHTLLWASMTMPISETGLILDLTRTKSTQVYYLNEYFAEHPDRFIMPRDYKLDLLDIVEPESIWVSVERMAHKELNVNVQADINPALGYMLVGDIKVEPTKVMVHGPVSLLNELTSITVPPYRVSDVNADVDVSLALTLEPAQLFSLETSAVTLRADIQSIGAVEFFNIPVRLENVPRNVEVSVIPQLIGLEAEGGLDRLLDLKPEDFVVKFDYSAHWDQNEQMYVPEAVLPMGVKRINRFIPDKIEIVQK
ncbi:MAG: YbbR-like domain-containing protein [Candidatus Marinimicrobia bacterium]|nr:YbbR-like domain-containing protein [Candidatus Neomarinimicrobiota bacterium]MCF7922054.1 YbbR-like domain-containing protein [Candidatus Neomarinimicrobiota bacterium]